MSSASADSSYNQRVTRSLSHRWLLSAVATLVVSALAPDVISQQATRSSYQAGPVQFGRLLLPTDLPYSVFVYYEDINKDSYTDLVIAGFTPIDHPAQGARPGTILLNNGNNTFRAATGDRPQSEWVREVLVNDFNGDGISDLFMADHGWDAPPFPGFQNQLMLGTGIGFVDASSRLPVLSDFSHNAAAGDINGDGRVDILVANNALGDPGKASYFLINRGDAGFELDRSRLPVSLRGVNTPTTWAVEIADMDKDGKVDLLVGRVEDQGAAPSRIYWNPGSGDFSSAQVTQLPDMGRFVAGGLYGVIEVQAFDLNADGLADIQLSAYDRSFKGLGTQFFYNLGGRQFIERTDVCIGGATQDPSSERETPYFFRLQDINGDNYPELLLVDNRDTSPQTPFFLENSAGGKWRAITRAALSSDNSVLDRLRFQKGFLTGVNEFGMSELFVFDSNGARTLGMNYVPITHTPQAAVANRFDGCSNIMRSSVAAGEFGNLNVSFKLVQSEPGIRIQILGNSLKQLTMLPEKAATFNSATGMLFVPELYVDDSVAYRGLQFRLVDGDQLIFELVEIE